MRHAPASLASSRSGWFRRALRMFPLYALPIIAAACGGDSSPSAPTPVTQTAPAAPTVSAPRIDGPDAVRTGFTSDYTATATFSNGTTQAVTPAWSSSDPTVAAVDGNGRVSGLAHGGITLTATHQGASATKVVPVVANYGGQWSGRFVMRACDQSGVFAAIAYCQNLGGVGATGPISLSLTQSGNDRAQLSGTISFGGGLMGNATGNVTADGRMVIGANFNVISSGVTFTFRVGGWESRLSGASGMTGRWADNLTAVNVPGNAYTENELQTMTRTSVAEAPSFAPQTIRIGLAEFFSSMRRPR